MPARPLTDDTASPTIGVFDSGVGGLSVLRALLADVPEARFVYAADSGFAPYGERSAASVTERTLRVAAQLRQMHGIDALVVACNTATALAIDSLRAVHPDLPIVGVEPALKPAAAQSRSGHIGVIATRGTVESERFARLRRQLEQAAERPLHFDCLACDGLAHAIERGDEATTRQLCERYIGALCQQEPAAGPPMDTLVLGCTHYPFAADILQALCGPDVALVETGAPVARRTRAVLGLSASGLGPARPRLDLTLLSTGDPFALSGACRRWLGLDIPAQALAP